MLDCGSPVLLSHQTIVAPMSSLTTLGAVVRVGCDRGWYIIGSDYNAEYVSCNIHTSDATRGEWGTIECQGKINFRDNPGIIQG